MSDIDQARAALVTRVLTGDGVASKDERRAAFDDAGVDPRLAVLVGKVARRASSVTDEDVAAARAAGYSEDQLFEIVVCAAVGAASRQYASALAALDAAAEKEPRAPRHPR